MESWIPSTRTGCEPAWVRPRRRSAAAWSSAAAVAGWYFWHPEATYFGVGKINRDQIEDYAERKGMELWEIERWLAPNLGYEP